MPESILIQAARGLSSGTIATLTGFKRYDELDPIHDAFVAFVKSNERRHGRRWDDNWMKAWDDFAESREYERVLPVKQASRDRFVDMDGNRFDVGSEVEYWPDERARRWRATVVGVDGRNLLVGTPGSPGKFSSEDAERFFRVRGGSVREARQFIKMHVENYLKGGSSVPSGRLPIELEHQIERGRNVQLIDTRGHAVMVGLAEGRAHPWLYKGNTYETAAQAIAAWGSRGFRSASERTAVSDSKVLQGYLEAMLFTETDDDGDPLDDNYSVRDIDRGSIAEAKRDVKRFLGDAGGVVNADGNDDDEIGHDFWLTRNGHGAGFWDGDYPEAGDILTEIAKRMGEKDGYVGDDGSVYIT